MDIRRFFKKPKLSNLSERAGSSDEILVGVTVTSDSVEQNKEGELKTSKYLGQCSDKEEVQGGVVNDVCLKDESDKKDIGRFLTQGNTCDTLKYELLLKPWTPHVTYDFKGDLRDGASRAFRHQWLKDYSMWLCYSRELKGAMCRTCILFKPSVKRGLQGSFITKPFTKYKDFNSSARDHMKSNWHRESSEKAKNFLDIYEGKQQTVADKIDSSHHHQIEQNRKKLEPILSTIIFCGTHDIPLRGKTSQSGVFHDLLEFRLEAGDVVLHEHLSNSAKNAKYTSHRIQNEMIGFCEQELREILVAEANSCNAFSVIADETADISGTEQLSIGIRFVKFMPCGDMKVHEEFLGFQPLEEMNAKSIATTILNFLTNSGLDLTKLCGQGYDGCATMAGREGGVAKLIQDRYQKAIFCHCASHKLNLVINDLNELPVVNNAAGTIKEIINFFRESPLRRKQICNLPLFCETRWSSKYKSIRLFSENFSDIMKALENISNCRSFNSKTRQRAHILHCSASNSSFIVAMHVMAKYSGILEPVTNSLQAEGLELFKVREHILLLLDLFKKQRSDAITYFQNIMVDVENTASNIGSEIKRPRLAVKQRHRDNHNETTIEDYYRVSLYIPYMDSLIQCLESRFGEQNNTILMLYSLHPSVMKTLRKEDFSHSMKVVSNIYKIDRLMVDAELWYDVWQTKDCRSDMTFLELLKQCKDFYPSVGVLIEICISLPATTCSAERSFSTLRRVKSWLRSTMTNDRLSGLCMLSLHRERVAEDKQKFMENVFTRFSREAPRRVQLLLPDSDAEGLIMPRL